MRGVLGKVQPLLVGEVPRLPDRSRHGWSSSALRRASCSTRTGVSRHRRHDARGVALGFFGSGARMQSDARTVLKVDEDC